MNKYLGLHFCKCLQSILPMGHRVSLLLKVIQKEAIHESCLNEAYIQIEYYIGISKGTPQLSERNTFSRNRRVGCCWRRVKHIGRAPRWDTVQWSLSCPGLTSNLLPHRSVQAACINTFASCCCSVAKACSILHELQHAKILCPSLSPWVCSNPCPLSQWCHLNISSSVVPFTSCPQFFPTSGFFQWVISSH